MKKKRANRIVTAFTLFFITLALLFLRYLDRDNSPVSAVPTPESVSWETPAPAVPTEAIVVEPTPEPTPVPTPEPTIAPDSPEGRALALGLPKPPDIDPYSWEFMLANGENSIAEYAPPQTVTLEGQVLDSRIEEPIKAMAADTRAQGLSVYLSSGYRSYNEQAQNFIRVCNNNGVSDGKNAQGFYITMPAGCSEHQTGLACDITDVYYPLKNSSLENTATFQYMSKHCHEFGFIVRFPKDQEAVTGVMYEPFHFRYVGVEAATYIMENGICLETFLSLYRDDIVPVKMQ